MHRVPIGEIIIPFHRAHSSLLRSSDPYPSSSREAQDRWSKVYNIQPISKNGVWKYLDFEDEYQYTMFILKWR